MIPETVILHTRRGGQTYIRVAVTVVLGSAIAIPSATGRAMAVLAVIPHCAAGCSFNPENSGLPCAELRTVPLAACGALLSGEKA